ncbi:MAG: flagellar hook-length control protein FliK [Nitrospira sp.]|nr:flagellar hook-length control protein FliK [Nitrospira sp.]
MEAREAAEARAANKSERGSRSRETKEPNPSSTQAERAAVRSTNTSDRGPRSMERKDQNPSATQAERVNASPSETQAQDQDGSRSSDDVKRVAEDSRNEFESTTQPSQPGFDSQGQATAPLFSLVSPQVLAQANDQTNVHTEGKGELLEDNHGAEGETESGDGFTKSPLISTMTTNSSVTVSDLPEDHAHADHDLLAHEPDAPAIHTGGDSHKSQVVKPASQMVADDVGPQTANRVETRPVPVELQSGPALPQLEAIVRQAPPASLGVGLPDGKPESTKTDSVLRDGGSSDRSSSVQTNWYGQFLQDAQNSGVRTQWGVQQGQRLSVDGAEHFSELWGDQQNSQLEQSEIMLPQATVIERQVSSGSATESMMAGAHGRVVSSPPPSPTPTVISPAPSFMPAQDATESSVRFMTRSVVFDVAQPDLGHVNIRVAMTNDMVHTHLSADRLEVGQFLVNGQDRLQAAFQANGLDMGQFRVDIDRQSAGRSFQQDSSQEQGHTWNQRSDEMKWGQSPDRQDAPHTSLHGLLNIVA